jgi:hypothetical protein
VLGRDTALLVTWSAPDDDGGSPITGYALSAIAVAQTVNVTTAASLTQASVTGLTDGTQYTLTLSATNSIGTSPAGTGSGTPSVAYPPAPPQHFSAQPDGAGGVVATWASPLDDGGDPITGYNLTYQQVVPDSTGTGWVPASGSSPFVRSGAGARAA